MISNGAESTNQIENENLDVRGRWDQIEKSSERQLLARPPCCTRSFA